MIEQLVPPAHIAEVGSAPMWLFGLVTSENTTVCVLVVDRYLEWREKIPRDIRVAIESRNDSHRYVLADSTIGSGPDDSLCAMFSVSGSPKPGNYMLLIHSATLGVEYSVEFSRS